MQLENSYANLPDGFSIPVETAAAPAPELLAWNQSLASRLGLDHLSNERQLLARIFSGSEQLPGGETIALAYAGHQFGHFVPQLGDGRAALLAEIIDPHDGQRFDIQLKGSGPTPFSRRGDGKAPLGPVIREYLVSEAMHRLGVPTTRSLAMVATGETVVRDRLEPGAVLTRVAASHIRIGTFEYFAARGEKNAIERLVDYAISRHYPHLAGGDWPALELFGEVVEAQARLIAHWMAAGFIHGVMNTDNCTISGETIDYGPCAFLDEFRQDKVFSSIDQGGRYAFDQQPRIGEWNLARLAESLLLIDNRPAEYQQQLARFAPRFTATYYRLMGNRLALESIGQEQIGLINDWLTLLQEQQLDYPTSYHQLAGAVQNSRSSPFTDFARRWLQQIDRQPGGRPEALERISATNPLIIPRNHLIEGVIQAAVAGDLEPFERLKSALAEPFDPQLTDLVDPRPPQPHQRITHTFCGT